MMTKASETNATANDTMRARFLRWTIFALFPLSILSGPANDPHKALENLERASRAATLWIFWGIVVEIGALIWFAHDPHERLVGILANVLIGLGLIFEYIVIGRAIIVSGDAQRLSDEKVAAAEDRAAQAHAQASGSLAMAAEADRGAATARRETAKLQADNLALQTAMLPRHAGLFGINEEPKSRTWFARMAGFAGVYVAIQADPADGEAMGLAREIRIVLATFGLNADIVDEVTAGVEARYLGEGVRVQYPTGKAWTADEPVQPWFRWRDAAEALADALTDAGLGVGQYRVSRSGFNNEDESLRGITPHFRTPLEGVFVQIGARPIAATVEWIKAGRPDAAGVKAADKLK